MSDARGPAPHDRGDQPPLERQSHDGGEDSEGGPPRDEGLLELVLERTARVSGNEDEVAPQTMERFLDVARLHRGLKLNADPVARELVETILRDTLTALKQPDLLWRSTALSIAQTLMEDPRAQQRMNSFWMRLSEAV